MKTRTIVMYLSFVFIWSLVGTANADLPIFDELWKQENQIELTEVKKAEVTAKMATMQIPFIVNQGQQDEQVAFYAKTFSGTVFVTKTGEIVYALPKTTDSDQMPAGVALYEEVVGGTVQQVIGMDEAVTRISYFQGRDPSGWQSNLPTYQSVNLGEVYDGIELMLKAYGNNVEKLFIVQPGAAPENIQLNLRGAQRITINGTGGLDVETPLGNVTFTTPNAYQEIAGDRKAVEVAYTTNGGHYGFQVGNYDKTRELIIDPLLASTFLGGNQDDFSKSIALGGNGQVYVSGQTRSLDFPTTSGAYINFQGSYDVFVSELTPDLDTLLVSAILGGEGYNVDHYLTLDDSGNVYVTGWARSSDFPITTDAYDPIFQGLGEAFVTKLSPDLSTLLASTFLGGENDERSLAIILDGSGNVYVAGQTWSSDFPTTLSAYDTSYNGGSGDGFVAKLSPDLHTLLASTFLGGDWSDYATSMTLDDSGNIYVAGHARSPNFPSTPGAYDTIYKGGWTNGNGFVARLSPDLGTLQISTFLGGTGRGGDTVTCITLDGSGDVYVTGHTNSSDFPTTPGAYDTNHNGLQDGFISKLSPNLDTLLISTLLGGNDWEYVNSMTFDSSGQIYVAGSTRSFDFPATPDAYDTSHNGGIDDAFVSRLTPDLSTLLTSTFLGGNGIDGGGSVTLDGSGNVYVAGGTQSSGFPTTSGAYDPSFNGDYDAFIAKFDSDLSAGIGPTPNQPPEAKITMTSQGQTTNENQTLTLIVAPGATAQVDFSASGSSDPEGFPLSYRWGISGFNGTEVITSSDFNRDLGVGTYQIALTVTDNQGAKGSAGASIVVTDRTSTDPVDPNATQETKTLFQYLKVIGASDQFIFGQEFPTDFRYTTGLDKCDEYQPCEYNQSDSKYIVGDHPGVHGSDFHYYLDKNADEKWSHTQAVQQAYDRGAVITFDWHMSGKDNPSYEWQGNENLVYNILNNVILNNVNYQKWFYDELDKVIAIIKQLGFPIVFRPFHEMNGDWFWWGNVGNTTSEDYKELYRLTVDYMRSQGVHNVLFCYSPGGRNNVQEFWNDFLSYYPGDAYVDVVGVDIYEPGLGLLGPLGIPRPDTPDMLDQLRKLTDFAVDNGKVAVFAETGARIVDIPVPQTEEVIWVDRSIESHPEFWTKKILYPIVGDPEAKAWRIAWILTWVNNKHWYLDDEQKVPQKPFIPYEGFSNKDAIKDFKMFYKHPATLFEKDLRKLITPDRQTASSPDGFASVFFPLEAIPEDTLVYIAIPVIDEASVPPPPEGWQLLGSVYDFTAFDADGIPITNFGVDLTLTLTYDPADLDGLDEGSLTIHYYDLIAGWVPLLPSIVDIANYTVTAETDHFTMFGIFGVPEPTTLLLLGTGLLGLLAFTRRRWKKRK